MDFRKSFLKVLNKYLGPYVENLSTENLETSIFHVWTSPQITFEHLKFKREVLTLLGYEGFVVTDGEIQRLEFRIPWKVLFTGKIKVIVDGVHLQVEQDTRASMSSSREETEKLKRKLRQEKQDAIDVQMQYLKGLKESQKDADPTIQKITTGARLVQRVISNVDVSVTRTKAAFRSSFRGLWCCARCNELAIYSTDEHFVRTDKVYPDGLIRKLLNIRDISALLATNEQGGDLNEESADHVVSPLCITLQLKQETGQEPDNDRLLSVKIMISAPPEDLFTSVHFKRSDVKHLMQLYVDFSREMQQMRELLVLPEEDAEILDNFDATVNEYCRLYMLRRERKETASYAEEAIDSRLQLLEDALPVRVIARQRFQLIAAAAVAARSGSSGSFVELSDRSLSGHSSASAASGGEPDATSSFISVPEEFFAELEKLSPVEYPNTMSFAIEVGKDLLELIDDRATDEHRDILTLKRDSTTIVNVDCNFKGDDMEFVVLVRIGAFEVTHAQKAWISMRQLEAGTLFAIDSDASVQVLLVFGMGLDYQKLDLNVKLAPIEMHCVGEALGTVLEVVTLPAEPASIPTHLYDHEENKERLREVQDHGLFEKAAELGAYAIPSMKAEKNKNTVSFELVIASPIVHVPVRDSGILTMSLGKLRVWTPEICGFNRIKVSVDLANTALTTRLESEEFEIAPPVHRRANKSKKSEDEKEVERAEGIHLDIDCQLETGETIVDMDMSFPGWSIRLVPEVTQILLAVPESLTAMLANREQSIPDSAANDLAPDGACSLVVTAADGTSDQILPLVQLDSKRDGVVPLLRETSEFSRPRLESAYSSFSNTSTVRTPGITRSSTLVVPSITSQYMSAAAATEIGAQKVAAYQDAVEEVRQSKITVKFAMVIDEDGVLMVSLANLARVPVLRLAVDLPPPGVQVHYQSEPSQAHLDLPNCSFNLVIMNSRTGEWEPVVEPTKFSIKLDQEEFDDSELGTGSIRTSSISTTSSRASRKDSSRTKLLFNGHEPLLINVTPTAINMLCAIAPLYQLQEQDVNLSTVDMGRRGNCRIFNLCQQEFELVCSYTEGRPAFTRHQETYTVKPGCELFLRLWTDTLSHAKMSVQVRLANQEPPAVLSDILSMGCIARCWVPGSSYIAQVFTAFSLHPTLLLTTAVCVHNQSALPVNVRFRARPGENGLVEHASSVVCDAATVGHKLLHCLHRYKSITSDAMLASSPEEAILLKPNELCCVPVEGITCLDDDALCYSASMSLEPCGLEYEFSDFCPFFTTCDKPQLLKCASRGRTDDTKDVRAMFFLCELDKTTESQRVRCRKPLTIAVKAPLVLTNSLPFGCLTVEYSTKSSKGKQRVELGTFDRLGLHDLEGPRGEEDITMRVWHSAESQHDDNDATRLFEKISFSREAVLRAEDFVSSELVPNKFEYGREHAGCISYELMSSCEVKFCCAGIFVDRSGLVPPSWLEVQLGDLPLEFQRRVALLPEAYHEASCKLVLRRRLGAHAVGSPLQVQLPALGWGSCEQWRTPDGYYEFCFQVENHILGDAHRTSCRVIVIRPRIVLSNLSTVDLDIRHSGCRKNSNGFCLRAGRSQEVHRCDAIDKDETDRERLDFKPRQGPQWALDAGGDIMCDDTGAGSWPFALLSNMKCELWSVDLAPSYGTLSVSFRQSSDFVAAHWATTKSPMIVKTSSEHQKGPVVFQVEQHQEVQYGWSNPFGKRFVEVFLENELLARLENVQEPMSQKVKFLPYVVQVIRRDKEMLLVLDDAEQDGPEKPEECATTTLFQIDVRLRHLGISIVQEVPAPLEMFYLGFNSVRFQMCTGGSDVDQYEFGIGNAKVDCLLPAYVHGLKQGGFQRVDEKTSVIFTNIDEGELPFLAISMGLRAKSHDTLVEQLDFVMDTLELTVETVWVQPLLAWVEAIDASRGTSCSSGTSISEQMRLAGTPIGEEFEPPDVPSVLRIESFKVSRLSLLIWCKLDLAKMPFIPGFVRGSLRVIAGGSRQFIVNGLQLKFHEHEFSSAGSFSDVLLNYLKIYAVDIGKTALMGLTKSNIASTQVADGSRQTAGFFLENASNATSTAAAQLRSITALAANKQESWDRRSSQANKTISGVKQGSAEAGASLVRGVGHVFDIVRKPIKGAKEDGAKGFFKGITTGAVGTMVKPVAGVLQAVGDFSAGLAASASLNKEEVRRHRQHQAQRLPRAMFGELGSLRSWSLVEALTLQQLGGVDENGISRLTGVAEIMPFVQVDSRCLVFLLFASYLEIVFVDLPPMEITGALSGPPVKVTDQESSVLFDRANALRPPQFRNPGLTAKCSFSLDLDCKKTVVELVWTEPSEGQDTDRVFFQLKITNGQGDHIFDHQAFKCPRNSLSNGSLQDSNTWYVLQAAMRSERGRLRKELRQSYTEESVVKARAFEIERRSSPLSNDWQTPFKSSDQKHLAWRWVDERGFRHPQLRRNISKQDCSRSPTPPCDYRGLSPVEGSDWKVDKNGETDWKVTDNDGWVYSSSTNCVVWDHRCSMSHTIRKRQWSRLFC